MTQEFNIGTVAPVTDGNIRVMLTDQQAYALIGQALALRNIRAGTIQLTVQIPLNQMVTPVGPTVFSLRLDVNSQDLYRLEPILRDTKPQVPPSTEDVQENRA